MSNKVIVKFKKKKILRKVNENRQINNIDIITQQAKNKFKLFFINKCNKTQNVILCNYST